MMEGDPAELLRILILMEDVQTSFHVMRLSATIGMVFVPRFLLPIYSRDTAAAHDTQLE